MTKASPKVLVVPEFLAKAVPEDLVDTAMEETTAAPEETEAKSEPAPEAPPDRRWN